MRSFPFAILAFSGLLLVPASAVRSQGNPVPAQPTLRTGANLVLVDVVVTEHDKPVHNLERNRFHIFEDGKEQTISSFDEHQPPSAPPAFLAPAALPPNTYTNVPVYPQSSAVNVLLLDGLNTSLGDQMQVRHKMIEYLGTLKPGTTLAVFTLGTKLHIVTQFTNDPAALLSLFKKTKTNPQQTPLLETPESTTQIANVASALNQAPAAATAAAANLANPAGFTAGPMNAAQALQQFQADSSAFQIQTRMDITIDAMKQLAGYLGGIPGRKNVIWFSGSFPLELLPDSSAPFAFGNISAFRERIQKATDMLTAARVAIYPVDAHGLWANTGFNAAAPFKTPSTASNRAQNLDWSSQRESQYAEEATMQQVADDTGGEAFLETNDFDKAVTAAVENGASYYTLAYAPKNGSYDGKYRKIEVRLDDGHGMKLAYRRGYYADAPASSSPGSDQETSAFAAALAHDSPGATGILFKVRVLPAADRAFQNVSLPAPAPVEKLAAFKGPAHRYVVDLTLDAHGLAFDVDPDGSRKASIELAMIAYDDNGQRLTYWLHAFRMGLNPAQVERLMASGITLRLPIDLPAGNVNLRIGVHDLTTDRAGSLEVPLQVAEK